MEQEETPTQYIPTRGEIRRKRGRNYLIISIASLAAYLIWTLKLDLVGMIGPLLIYSVIVFLFLGVNALIKAKIEK